MFLKKSFLAALFISTCFFAQAQFQTGDYSIGVGANPFWMKNYERFDFKMWNATLDGEYFISDKFSSGLALGIDGVSSELYKRKVLQWDLFSRYYFLNNPMKKRRFQPYIEGFLRGEHMIQGGGREYDNWVFGKPNLRAGLGIGMNYFVSKKFAIDAAFRYDRELTPNPIDKNNMEIKVGMKYRF